MTDEFETLVTFLESENFQISYNSYIKNIYAHSIRPTSLIQFVLKYSHKTEQYCLQLHYSPNNNLSKDYYLNNLTGTLDLTKKFLEQCEIDDTHRLFSVQG